MKEDLESIIKELQRAQDMIHKKRYDEAIDTIYQAQSEAQFLKDNRA